MRAKVVTIKELTEDNPTLCLSTRRVFNKCNQCPTYKGTEDKTRLKCKPHFNKGIQALEERKKKLLYEIKEVNRAIAEL